ncbi:MAG: hypothetical protein IKB38_06895 [Clostridia bacterium]|nr:hypothetical protein [Clostridia bacterium]MBR2466634.1 hypothetical protein [Clostridia bacterium]
MTRYNITAERTNGTQFTDTVYAADEKTARRDFNEIYRHADKPKIISVVALGDGYQASKAQEREALAEIRSIVESLGNNSYIAIAFKGCLEDAAENIENDWALSMYDRWQTAEAKISELEADVRKATSSAKATKSLADAYEKALEEAIEKSLTPDEIETLQHIVFEKQLNNDSENSAAAKAIVENAEHPESEAFQTAVRKHRDTTAIKAQLDALANRLSTIIRNSR